MSPLAIVMIVAFRIATSCAASGAVPIAAPIRVAPPSRRVAEPPSRRVTLLSSLIYVPSVEASFDENVFDGVAAREQVVPGHDDEVGQLARFDRADSGADAEQL